MDTRGINPGSKLDPWGRFRAGEGRRWALAAGGLTGIAVLGALALVVGPGPGPEARPRSGGPGLDTGVLAVAPGPIPPGSLVPPDDIRALRDLLRTSTLARQAEGPLLLAYLADRQGAGADGDPGAEAYWQSPALREVRSRLLGFRQAEAQRAALVAAFGPGVVDDPAYAALFRPFRAALPDVPSVRQLEIQAQFQALDQAVAAALTRASIPGAPSGHGPGAGDAVAADPEVAAARSALVALLDRRLNPQERAAFGRRHSPLARSLAASGFDFSQGEFDAVYDRLAAGPWDPWSAGPVRRFDPDSLAAVRQVLGAERFEVYRRQQDPLFQLVRTVVMNHGPPATDVNAVYGVVREAAAQLATRRGRPVPDPGMAARWSDEQSRRDQQLRELLGEEAAAILTASLEANPPVPMP